MRQVRGLFRTARTQFRLLLWSAGIIALIWALRFVCPQEPLKKAGIIDFTAATAKHRRRTKNMPGKQLLEGWDWPHDAGKKEALLDGLKRSEGNIVVLDPKQEIEALQEEASKEKPAE
ncbi:hypothetical protein [Pseudoflavonifractor phocaeensis]|uniref:hypothetical protein n=1 Tax=Pseudoflavonifractor phocaeensis TaxID=1870988 RepID=UPI00195A126D|nr:hypothetical protein [Pseudoflavonifractor phocaeensis]MBM6724237.1 hypothetical protein [Pseudoflavonifractor phocaeensis]